MEADIRAGRFFGRQEDKKKKFGDLVDRMIEEVLPNKPDSFQKLKTQLLWWNSHLKDYYLCHITSHMISDLKGKLINEKTPRGDKRTGSTGNRYLAALSKAFTNAVDEWGWVKENPARKVGKFEEGKPRERYLTEAEINLLLDECKESKSPHVYAVALFGLSTAARKSEILNVKWSDICLQRKTAIFRDTKNGETRVTPLNDKLIECLLDKRAKQTVFSEYVFPSRDGKKGADIRTAYENIVERLGLKDVLFHTLRHTVATHLGIRNTSIPHIAKVGGWKSYAMVKQYTHLSVESTADILNDLNDDLLKGVGDG
jgi:integrase